MNTSRQVSAITIAQPGGSSTWRWRFSGSPTGVRVGIGNTV